MKSTNLILLFLAAISFSCKVKSIDTKLSETARFNIKKDLLIGNFDCKTDVDDIHSVAAFYTLLSHPNFSKIKHHAVAGTYGTQEGLYVPPNPLFQLAFEDNWTDAHNNLATAVEKTKRIVKKQLEKGGDIWLAEAGQSDFSAALVKAIQLEMPNINTNQRFHVVQHSDWNEKVTSAEALQFVKEHTDYQKIADGNVVDNGTPGYNSAAFKDWQSKVTDSKIYKIWKLATDIGNQYNGKEGRYLNKSIAAGGLDFSDIAEVCWILGLENIKDGEEFFDKYSR